jgi:PAS domain S-box-containing protein
MLTLLQEQMNATINDGNLCRLMVEEIEDYAIFFMNDQGLVMTWNKGAEKIKGYKAEEIIGKSFHSFYTKEDIEKKVPENFLEAAALYGKARDGGWRVKKDGTYFWANILITAIRDCDNNLIGFSKVTRDFTDQKTAEEIKAALWHAKDSFRKIFDASPSAMAVINVESLKFVEVNQNFVDTFEHSREQVVGLNVNELGITPHDRKLKLFAKLQQKGFVRNEEVCCYTRSGKKIDIIFSVDIFELNTQVCALCIFHDISHLAEKKKVIEQKNKDILDSINYAKRIQNSIFPPEDLVKTLIPGSFVLYKPKDIVSGDFYWVEQIQEKIFIAAVDCTGHGVPGALMSIVGHNLLSKSINEQNHITPADILNELSRGVLNTLRYTTENSVLKDAMDISLCVLDKLTNKLEFAGAYNNMYLIRNNQLTEIVADRFPIGVFLDGELKKFSNRELQLQKGDTIYLFTDGYPDQFGGPKGKKLKNKGFKEILLSIQYMSMPEQKQILNKTFEEWKYSSEEQTDDILVIGIRIE